MQYVIYFPPITAQNLLLELIDTSLTNLWPAYSTFVLVNSMPNWTRSSPSLPAPCILLQRFIGLTNLLWLILRAPSMRATFVGNAQRYSTCVCAMPNVACCTKLGNACCCWYMRTYECMRFAWWLTSWLLGMWIHVYWYIVYKESWALTSCSDICVP